MDKQSGYAKNFLDCGNDICKTPKGKMLGLSQAVRGLCGDDQSVVR